MSPPIPTPRKRIRQERNPHHALALHEQKFYSGTRCSPSLLSPSFGQSISSSISTTARTRFAKTHVERMFTIVLPPQMLWPVEVSIPNLLNDYSSFNRQSGDNPNVSRRRRALRHHKFPPRSQSARVNPVVDVSLEIVPLRAGQKWSERV